MNGTPFVIGAIVAILAVGAWNWYDFFYVYRKTPVSKWGEDAFGRKFANLGELEDYLDDEGLT